MKGQGDIGVHQPAGLRQGQKAPQKAEILEKGAGDLPSPLRQERQQQAEVHGDAAELKGEIPPVVDAGMHHQGEKELFVDLAHRQEYPAEKQPPQGPSPSAV